MVFNRNPLLSFFLLLFISFCFAQNNYRYVNVFIGTEGTGHTFPGPSMPFGMVQPGPDNKDHGWNHTSGYQYKDTLLLGFSQTRFSGTGINEMGDVLLLPINPKKENLKNGYYKNTEFGKVGYYTLTKKDDVKVELTCSERVAFHRYTFPEKEAKVLLDLQHGLHFVFDESNPKGLVVESDVKIENSTTISGYCATQNWVNRKYFFTLTFDQPFVSSQLLEKKANEKAPRYFLDFNLNDSKELKVKIALSSVSVAGAKLNRQTEIPNWDFDAVVIRNKKAWDTYLNRIDIEAPQKQKEIFYTSLYHLFLQPSNIADVDGKYRGVNDQIALAPNKEYYSTLSIWDIYRGAFPLLQIVAPEKVNGIINSMLIHHKAKGFLPIWTAWGQDNYCMIGNHAIPMLLSAYQNGFTGFDKNEALKAMVETSTKSHINSDWELYTQYGYYPFDKLDNEAVSRTLESGYDDWCVAEMARKLGSKKIATTFFKRALYYQNIFDNETTFFRGKDTKGNWRSPFNPLQATSPLNNPGDYTEANAWQYFWTPAQHDVNGVIKLLGGKANFTKKLNAFFTTEAENPNKFLGQEAMIGQYAHGNEPSHHILYLYAFTNEPKTGQKYIHKVINEFHNNTPDGMIGNDDCGQMSAWYLLSTLGFYPVNPANGEFIFGSPQIKKAILHLKNGKEFKIEANNYSNENSVNENRFLNGSKIAKSFITYKEIMAGGTLTFEMTNN
ncbi:GH92 family glycosyl hydrolase [Flavobacterium sp. N1994]|uniref:GH92 family glycosyl hydrolase n=1 Tax=Flavobacterium sp. N1994 TaxID=2986827 RepID=UPI002222D7BB|nr:GH92 family glycosyl hydrolase [Flavobacterium sp. N1994]